MSLDLEKIDMVNFFGGFTGGLSEIEVEWRRPFTLKDSFFIEERFLDRYF